LNLQFTHSSHHCYLLLLFTALLLPLLLRTRAVHLVEQSQRGGPKGIGLSRDAGVVGLGLCNNLAGSSDLFLDVFGLILVELILKILQGLLGVIGNRVGTVGTHDQAFSVSPYFSPSSSIDLISESLRSGLEEMVMDWSLLVAMSFAEMWTMESASMSKVTSI
jgi:hypothetical protein